jgi:hypothetical protein
MIRSLALPLLVGGWLTLAPADPPGGESVPSGCRRGD